LAGVIFDFDFKSLFRCVILISNHFTSDLSQHWTQCILEHDKISVSLWYWFLTASDIRLAACRTQDKTIISQCRRQHRKNTVYYSGLGACRP